MVFRHYREVVTEQDAKLYFAVAPEIAKNVVQMKARAA